MEISILPENITWYNPPLPPINQIEFPMNCFILCKENQHRLLEDETEVFQNKYVIIKVPKECRKVIS
jgi:hypothetical protein